MLAGDYVEVMLALSYADYMAAMETVHICIDSYHFGGCNTVADGLFLGKPTVTWEGDKWYNRIGSQMLRLAGLKEMAASSEEEYLEIALRLINDDDYRAEMEEKVRTADLENTVFGTQDAKYFQKAIDYLIANHERLQQDPDRTPIRIERDET